MTQRSPKLPLREKPRPQTAKLPWSPCSFPTTCSLQGTEYLPQAKGTFIDLLPKLDVARGRYSQPCSQVGNSDAASCYQHSSNLFHFKWLKKYVLLSCHRGWMNRRFCLQKDDSQEHISLITTMFCCREFAFAVKSNTKQKVGPTQIQSANIRIHITHSALEMIEW